MTGSTTTRLTKRAAAVFFGALLLFGVGTNVQAGWVLVIAASLAGMLVVGLVMPIRALTGIAVSRSAPRTAVAGEAIATELVVTNTSRRPRSLFRVTDDFCGRALAVVTTLGGGQTRRYTSLRADTRRGVYHTGAVELTSGMPFGFLRVTRRDDVDTAIVVYPKVFDARAVELLGPSGWPAPSSVGDVSSVRDYRPGDPLRHIHWRSAARRGQLMVREFDREHSVTTAVLAAVPDDADIADAIASVACSIAIAGLRDGEVTIDGQRVRSADAVLDWGARLSPHDPTAATTASVMASASKAEALFFVGSSSVVDVGALASHTSSTSASVVLIEDGTPPDHVVGQLRSAGCTVAVVPPAQIESWLATRSAAS